ncbi:MAG: OsmC family protein [Bryobacteraceae bacterium]
MPQRKPLEYFVTAGRVDAHASIARCKGAELVLDTDLAGRSDAFNPAELLLAALSACMIKGIARVAPMLRFQYRGVEVRLHGIRQDVPPKMSRIEYEITVDTEEPDHRLDLLHDNVRKFGTVFNTVARGTELRGTLQRAVSALAGKPAA